MVVDIKTKKPAKKSKLPRVSKKDEFNPLEAAKFQSEMSGYLASKKQNKAEAYDEIIQHSNARILRNDP